IAGVLEALVGWAEFFLRLGPEGFILGPFIRAFGTFGQPNPFAGYLGMTFLLGFALLLAARGSLPDCPAPSPGGRTIGSAPADLRALLRRFLGPWALLLLALFITGAAILMSLSR